MSLTPEWWEVRGNVVDLLRWLADNWPMTVGTAIDVVEKPWHYTVEYGEMVAERELDQISGADRAKERVG